VPEGQDGSGENVKFGNGSEKSTHPKREKEDI